MPKIRSLLFIAAMCFTCNLISSQKVYREGYIVKSDGNRIEGLVAYSSGKKIPENCTFKRFDIAVPLTYNASDLKSFGYRNGKRYESVESGGKKKFFETLVYGDLTLLFSGSGYFLRKNDLPMIDLDSKDIKWSDRDGEKVFRTKEDLMIYLASGTQILKDRKPESGRDLVPIVSAYNKKEGKNYTVFNRAFSEKELANSSWQSGAARSRVGVIAGINLYSLKLKPKEAIFCPSPEPEAGIAFGITYERVISRVNDRLSLRGDLIYLSQNFYTYNEGLNYYKLPEKDDAFFDFSAVRLPLMLQYSFTDKRFKPYINGGVSASFFLTKNYFHVNETESYDNWSIYISEDSKMQFRKSEISLAMGGGIKMRISGNTYFHIEARVEAGSGIFDRNYPVEKGFKQYSIQPEIFARITF